MKFPRAKKWQVLQTAEGALDVLYCTSTTETQIIGPAPRRRKRTVWSPSNYEEVLARKRAAVPVQPTTGSKNVERTRYMFL